MIRKIYLLLLKYLPHFISLFYIIYTLFQFINIDLIILGHLIHVSIVSWIFMILSSIVFKFCYVHRLPLYYILLNEFTTILDYYKNISISNKILLGIHLLFIGLLILGYSYYVKRNKTYFKTIINRFRFW